jgi:hypothetical protein
MTTKDSTMTNEQNKLPIKATSEKLIRELEFDNIEMRGGFGALLSEDSISVHDGSGAYTTIPRAAFDDLVVWYTTGTIPKHDSRLKKRKAK